MRSASLPLFSLSRIGSFSRIGIVTIAATIAVSLSACTLGSVPIASAPEADPTSTVIPTRYQNSPVEFEHFTVTASRINAGRDQVFLEAKVCVRSIPSSYVGERIRISWDPWSVTAGATSAAAGLRGKAPGHLFRADGDYKVGGCVSGLIPFNVKGDLDTVTYANATGDKAIWDADSLMNQPPS